MTEPVLSIRDLSVSFRTHTSVVRAVDKVSFDVYPGETLGVVGESGSGKSVTMLSLLGLIPPTARFDVSGQALFQGRDLLQLSKKSCREVRGRDIALVPQDPMTCLDPLFTVGNQVGEAVRGITACPAGAAPAGGGVARSVGFPQPERRYDQYPHQYRAVCGSGP